MPDAPEVEAVVAAVEAGTDGIAVPETLLREDAAAPASEEPKARSLYAEIVGMSVPEKIKLALRGNRDARMILVHDANRVIRRLVLQNPRMSDAEVVALTRNKNADDELLRLISERRDWVRFYGVRLGLATNPKTPLAIAMRQLPTLNQRDVQQLAKSRNVPSAVAAQARRMVATQGQRG
ncbi:MAG TPA: hypothetical protein VKW76_15010 [Candidatus Binatia bacterium]|nr:hypothetical protein [Candidatus Binatia bacterium]